MENVDCHACMRPGAKEINDFRPVALTLIIAKCMERIVCNQLIVSVANRMDPLQFAYRARRRVEDATLTLFDLISSHLDSAGTTVKSSFYGFLISVQYHPTTCFDKKALGS